MATTTKPRHISSPSNADFRLFKDVLTGRGLKKHQCALLSGNKIIREVLDRYPKQVRAWLTLEKGEPPAIPVSWLTFTKDLFKELDVIGTGGPLIVVDLPTLPEWKDTDPWPEGCSLIVPFQNPENVGAVLRSATAFGVARVILTTEAGNPFHPKSLRAAGPAFLQTPLWRGPSIHDLEVKAVPLVTMSANGRTLGDAIFPERFALLPGVEGPGLPEHLNYVNPISIPMQPGVESLNAATATAIVLYVWKQSGRLC